MSATMCPPVITTDRLQLRPWSFDDLPDVLSYATDEEFGRYLPVPRPYDEAQARRYIASQILLDGKQRIAWAIRRAQHTIGGINVSFHDDFRIAELGYAVSRAHWGQGLASEAARAVIATAFTTHPQLARVRAMADARNTRSHRVMEKVGMTREGLLRHNRIARGEMLDEVWYGILRAEWPGIASG
jgi:ribosomal-protein-alanine N-acetyltransferase